MRVSKLQPGCLCRPASGGRGLKVLGRDKIEEVRRKGWPFFARQFLYYLKATEVECHEWGEIPLASEGISL